MKERTGISIRVLSGEEEAKLDFMGVVGKTGISDAIILDTGGGSVEFIGVKNGEMTNCESIQIGSRSIKELFFKDGETEEAKNLAKEKVEEIISELKWLDDFCGVPIVGIGGSNRTVARICIAEKEDKPIESYTVEGEKVFEIFDKIGATSPEKRGEIKGITPDRTDIIYGGLLPLTVLMERIKSDKLIVTDAGLRDGIAEKIIKNRKNL